MTQTDLAQIYLITPSEVDVYHFPDLLARTLDTVEVACLRLALSSSDESEVARVADALRDVAHARDIAVVIDRHSQLVEKLGLDGVHMPDGGQSLRTLRKTLGEDSVIGQFCGASRHDGMAAGEAGADYISFGPINPTALGDGTVAEDDLFAWWSEMIEVPVVAEGGMSVDRIRALADKVDFFAMGPEAWQNDNPIETLKDLAAARAG